MERSTMARVLSVVAAAVLVFGLSSSARADLIISLDTANANLATQGAGPYGQIDISGGSGSFTAVVTGENGFVFGDGGIVALNFSTGAGTATLGTVSSCTPACGTFTQDVAGNEDGFGTFNFRLDDGPGFSFGGYSTFTFTFTTSNGAQGLAGLLAPNAGGSTAAGHEALGTNTSCTGFSSDAGTQGTGTVDNSACTSRVAEPSVVFLTGLGLSGLAVVARRLRAR